MVNEGLTAVEVGNTEPSQTNRFGTSCERQSALIIELLGSLPMRRAEQMRCPVSHPDVFTSGSFEDFRHLLFGVRNDLLVILVVRKDDVRDWQSMLIPLRLV